MNLKVACTKNFEMWSIWGAKSVLHWNLVNFFSGLCGLFLLSDFLAKFPFKSKKFLDIMENVRQVVAWTVLSVFMRKYFIFCVSFYKPSIKIVSAENTNPP